MGKYTKQRAEVPSSINGVLTRARALALQKAQAPAGGSYIQLRSRRLVKPILTAANKDKKNNPKDCEINKKEKKLGKNDLNDNNQEEGSIGENIIETEQEKGRTTRETTPCNLIRNPDAIRTPSSSTKPVRSTDHRHRVQNATPRNIPSTSEMEEFFIGPEKQQQQLFIEKYNFDPVNDKPLDGRYEWVKLDATKSS